MKKLAIVLALFVFVLLTHSDLAKADRSVDCFYEGFASYTKNASNVETFYEGQRKARNVRACADRGVRVGCRIARKDKGRDAEAQGLAWTVDANGGQKRLNFFESCGF